MRVGAFFMAAALAVATIGCGSDDPAPAGGSGSTTAAAAAGPDLSAVEFVDLTGQEAVRIDARDNVFKQQYVLISAGTVVTFKNAGRNQHNVLPVDEGAFPSIEVDDFAPGTEVERTFDEAGDYPYYCSLHGTTTKGMVGAIRVVE